MEMREIWERLYDWDVERFLDEDYAVVCDCEACSFMREQGLLTPDGATTEKGRIVLEFGKTIWRRRAET